MEQVDLRRKIHGPFVEVDVKRVDWQDEAAPCAFGPDLPLRAGKHPGQQVPRAVRAVRIPTVRRVEHQARNPTTRLVGQRRVKVGGVPLNDLSGRRIAFVQGPTQVGRGPLHHRRIEVEGHHLAAGERRLDEEAPGAGHRVQHDA